MKHYTETISADLAEKLKEKGMPITVSHETFSRINKFPYEYIPMYAECFDWLMERRWLVSISREYDFATEQVTERFEWAIEKVGCFSSQPDNGSGWCDTWHEAANAAIEKALELIK